MEFTKDLEQLFDANKAIDTMEKNVLSVLSYVQPKEVSKTLSDLATAHSNFARANLEALKNIADMTKASTEEFTKKFNKSVK